ncbi:ABC transporter permease [[Clostridium] hylemonae]|uniref:Branched-chain amino acid ABC transporter, permease protein n=1 Tax=[Clostridium] hylemonae DSM 15053 TaxID=553973 RepID=C0C6H1_9FIRM|nr:ABC transporter permease [[Clostridium] hylemonae]EEG72306.1 branched-chain amino acid ABC transporter, permease protein [[Clostridium] hylemonae DSM 15053]MCB7522109.1 ABC transporter permease [[Clostridium] hylemonae]QEK16855.1 Ribose import permease protein RbsC [[Clostridium] hylemonae DSM 15053]BDF03487.1 sugar ABC transporter permease [[Clostridium] hylemonae]
MADKNRSKPEFFGGMLARRWLLFFTAATAIVFGIISPAFLQVTNLLNILSNACIVGVMGVGLTCIFATGELDFSAGAQVSLASCLMAVILGRTSFHNYIGAVLLTLLVLGLVGIYNAFLHVKIGIPAFIATLGTSYLVKGAAKALTNSKNVNNLSAWPKEFTFMGQGYLFGIIPMPVVILVIAGALILFYTEYTRAGKYLYAVGANPTACDYIGIDGRMQKVKGFVITAVLCGLAGIMQGSQMNAASPTLGENMFVPALTTVFLGAAYGKIGVFNVPGTLVGAVLYALINQGLLMITSELWLKNYVQGGMLLFALIMVVVIRSKGHKK